MIKLFYLPNLSWFCSYSDLVCELIAARDERCGKIQNFCFLLQVLIRIASIDWNLLDSPETSFFEHFFILSIGGETGRTGGGELF